MDLTKFVSPTKRFGTVLVENHVLSPKDLVQGFIGQVRSIVLRLFTWPEADYAFEDKDLEKETITLRIPTPKLVVDGVRQVTSWRRVTGGIGSLDAVYQTNVGVDEAASGATSIPRLSSFSPTSADPRPSRKPALAPSSPTSRFASSCGPFAS